VAEKASPALPPRSGFAKKVVLLTPTGHEENFYQQLTDFLSRARRLIYWGAMQIFAPSTPRRGDLTLAAAARRHSTN